MLFRLAQETIVKQHEIDISFIQEVLTLSLFPILYNLFVLILFNRN